MINLPSGSDLLSSAAGSLANFALPGFMITAGTLVVDALTRDQNNQGGILNGLISLLPDRAEAFVRSWTDWISEKINGVTQPIETALNNATDSVLGRVTGEPPAAGAITPEVAAAAAGASNPSITPSSGTLAPIAPVAGTQPQVQVS